MPRIQCPDCQGTGWIEFTPSESYSGCFERLKRLCTSCLGRGHILDPNKPQQPESEDSQNKPNQPNKENTNNG